MGERKHIKLGGPTAGLPFSDAVLVNGTLYMSGRIGIDASGRVPADPEQEVRFMLDGFAAVLRHAGMSMHDLVYVTVYCTDLSLYDLFNRVYRSYFGEELPARAFIGAGSLLRAGHFEMQAIAVQR
jgi:2-iminobutanoate/2-iminopropanoate deaminase